RCVNEILSWLKGYAIHSSDSYRPAVHLNSRALTNELVSGNVQPRAAAQHEIVRARPRCKCCESQHKQNDQRHAHEVASLSANRSIAAATPLSSFESVSCQP